jgi:lipopolysaccharide export system protein LptA
MTRFVLTGCLWVLLLLPQVVRAESTLPLRSKEPIHVSADRLDADMQKNIVTFTGQVTARQGDVAIHARSMTVHYTTGGKGDVERAEFSGDVRIVQNERVAVADRGLFLNHDGKVVLSGHAEVHEAGSSVSGDEIVYYLNEARSVISSEPSSRVNAVFRPQGASE